MVKVLLELADGKKKDIHSVSQELRKLTALKLHNIKDTEAIRNICHEVITAVDILLLVHVDEGALEKRKIAKEKKRSKNQQLEKIIYSEVDTNRAAAKIRADWDTKKWKKNPPFGWVWKEKERIIGVIYQAQGQSSVGILIDREIADNPHGASLLIEKMKEKIKRLST